MKQVEFQKETMGVEQVKQGSAIPKIECKQFIPILLTINMWIQQKPALLGQELGSQIYFIFKTRPSKFVFTFLYRNIDME